MTMYLEPFVCPINVVENTSDNPYQFHCTKCPKSFADNKSIANHFRLEHFDKKIKKYECDRCGKVYPRSFLLTTHIKSAHDNIRDHICPVCQKGFSKRSVLKRHIKCVHSGIKNFICELCGKAFSAKKNLQFHIDGFHHRLKPHHCMFCTKTFPRRCDLVRHNQCMHSENKKYNCAYCPKGFPQKWHLDRHVNAVHFRNGAKPKPREPLPKDKDDELPSLTQVKLNQDDSFATQQTSLDSQTLVRQQQQQHLNLNPETANLLSQTSNGQETIQFIDSVTGMPIVAVLNGGYNLGNGLQNIPLTLGNQYQPLQHSQPQQQKYQQIVTNNGTFLIPINTDIIQQNPFQIPSLPQNQQQQQQQQTLCVINNDGSLISLNVNSNDAINQIVNGVANNNNNNSILGQDPQSILINQVFGNQQQNIPGNVLINFPIESNSNLLPNAILDQDQDNKNIVHINLNANEQNFVDGQNPNEISLNYSDINAQQQQQSNNTIFIQNLTENTKVKENAKVFLCNFCDRYYARKQSLTSHIALKHSSNQPFVCLICSKGFARCWDFYRHVNSLHKVSYQQAMPIDKTKDFESWLEKTTKSKMITQS